MRVAATIGLMNAVLLLLLLLLATITTVADAKNPLRRMRHLLNLDALEMIPSFRAASSSSSTAAATAADHQQAVAAAKKLMEMELFERLLEGDGSLSLSMAPSAPSRPSPPSAPSPPTPPTISTPTVPSTPTAPDGGPSTPPTTPTEGPPSLQPPPTAPTPPTSPQPPPVAPPLPPPPVDGPCCDPNERPDGQNDRPLCFEGSTCCSDGNWQCNEGDGSSTCSRGEGPECPATSPVAPPAATPNNEQPQFETATCSDYTACQGLAGDCCPTVDGVLLDCCYGITPVPSVAIFTGEGTSAPEEPAATPVPAPSSSSVNPTTLEPSLNPTPEPSLNPTPKPSSVTTLAPSNDSSTSAPSKAPSDGTTVPETPEPSQASSTPSPSPSDDPRDVTIASKCGKTVEDRSNDIVAIVSGVSSAESLANSNSPQYKANEWIDKFDENIVCADVADETIQRYIVAVLYFALNGPEWTKCQAASDENDSGTGSCEGTGLRWLSASSECQWYGLTCGDDGTTLTKITLKDNGLDGTLPPELFALTELKGLSLDHNKKIGGTIPDNIGDLVNLEYIELDDNALRGSIPDALYGMTTLKAIDLNGNKLQGTLSDDIGDLTELMVLQIEDNELNGTIPWFGLGRLNELLVLYVHGNNFDDDSSLEAICNVMDDRRVWNPGYVQFMAADCSTSNIACSCCSECF